MGNLGALVTRVIAPNGSVIHVVQVMCCTLSGVITQPTGVTSAKRITRAKLVT
jgi:hypothetical protein